MYVMFEIRCMQKLTKIQANLIRLISLHKAQEKKIYQNLPNLTGKPSIFTCFQNP